jgi:hypothetical protein
MSTDHKPSYDPAGEINILNLQFVHVERFAFIVKTLMENGLFDEAIKHLQNRGCHLLAISIEPLDVIQGMLRERRAVHASVDDLGVEPSAEMRASKARLLQFEACACSGPKYPPRPPDNWPEGPWDPPPK